MFLFIATTARTSTTTDSTSSPSEGVTAVDGDVTIAHQPQPATGDPTDTQVQPTAHGSLHQTKTGWLEIIDAIH